MEVEWGVFDKQTEDLLSCTTFYNKEEAEKELVEIFSSVYAYVRIWTENDLV